MEQINFNVWSRQKLFILTLPNSTLAKCLVTFQYVSTTINFVNNVIYVLILLEIFSKLWTSFIAKYNRQYCLVDLFSSSFFHSWWWKDEKNIYRGLILICFNYCISMSSWSPWHLCTSTIHFIMYFKIQTINRIFMHFYSYP